MSWSGIKRNATDALFSDAVRGNANWICEKCKRDFKSRPDIFDCSHFITRGNKRLRWDFENALALCRGCHKYFSNNPDEHTEFVRKKLGDERFDLLRARKERKWNDSKIDEKAIRQGLKFYLKQKKYK